MNTTTNTIPAQAFEPLTEHQYQAWADACEVSPGAVRNYHHDTGRTPSGNPLHAVRDFPGLMQLNAAEALHRAALEAEVFAEVHIEASPSQVATALQQAEAAKLAAEVLRQAYLQLAGLAQ